MRRSGCASVEPPEKDRRKLREGKEAPERPVVDARTLAKLRAQLAASGQ